jgi:hypothetical protein
VGHEKGLVFRLFFFTFRFFFRHFRIFYWFALRYACACICRIKYVLQDFFGFNGVDSMSLDFLQSATPSSQLVTHRLYGVENYTHAFRCPAADQRQGCLAASVISSWEWRCPCSFCQHHRCAKRCPFYYQFHDCFISIQQNHMN